MIVHTVSFRWKPEMRAGQLELITAGLRGLPSVIPSIRSYSCGTNLGVSPSSNFDYAVVATFDDVDGWKAYDVHPEHDRILRELILPWVDTRAALQFQA